MDCYGAENGGLAETTGCHDARSNGLGDLQQEQQRDQEGGVGTFLPAGFDTLEKYLACLQTFLTRCEPVTNLMIVDYFTTNSWETRMPQDWRDAFESQQGKLSSLDLMELVSLGKLRDFKQGPSPSAPSVGGPCPSGSREAEGSAEKDQGPQDWPESLKDFIRMVKKLSINRTLDPDFTKFKNTLDIHLTPGMSPKKLHEVEILSGLIASYAKEHAIGSVIDLGAGQGYLSRVLAFQHQLCVLGVDSNTIQTCGAQTTQKRTEKLFVNKTKLKSTGGGKKSSSRQNRQSRTGTPTLSTSSSLATTTATPLAAAVASEETSIAVSAALLDEPFVSTSTPSSPIVTFDVVLDGAAPTCKKAKTESRSRSSSPADCVRGNSNGPCKRSNRSRRSRAKKDDGQSIPNSGASTPITTPVDHSGTSASTTASTAASTSTPASISASPCMITSASDTPNPDQQQELSKVANALKLATTPGSNFQLQHITHHITAATLPTLLKEHFPRKSKPLSQYCGETSSLTDEYTDEEEARWTLCGLHACGDLTSNMIKLYLESSATCLFSVGCCYHWITERFDKDGNIAISDGSHGFPLSAAFNQHKAHLGEHAKMIACQSPERWLKYQKETEDAIHGHYFRALLHKLMVERGLYPGPPAVAPVLGRMGKHRLKGFPHYLTTAINRLRLPADVIRPEEAQAAYEQFLEKDLYRIGILWALRTMLGPLFEGMILLDRATYLHENIVGETDDSSGKGLKKGSVQLVAGFDVVESPRNMILIALKD